MANRVRCFFLLGREAAESSCVQGRSWGPLSAWLIAWACTLGGGKVLLAQELPLPNHSPPDRSPLACVQRMQVPEGLEVALVASEPLVRQPVAIEFDDRGRLWVIQYLQYPNPEGLSRVQVDRYSRTIYDRIPEPPPHGPRGADRITILEDTNGDGVMDSSHDFVDGLNLATGLAFGHGGVFVLNVPYLLFYPDRDRNDIPDADPTVCLSGFGMEDAHSVANSLTWGPDGWLYGCQGSTVTANIRGVEFQQGVWRYHPVSDQFELFCEGGGNTWGLDFDAGGELLYSTNYGGHLLVHGVQGGYFVKSFAKHGPLQNPFAYGYFEHAFHDDFRGGHVTVGGIVYQADALPEKYRNKYIAADLLGHNIYWHYLLSESATFRTRHGGDLLRSHDTWFAPCDVTTGPDGAIYVADWHDQRTAHPDPDADWDRSNGRIYRIAPPNHSVPNFDFARLTSDELLELHEHPNQWMVRRARQELVRRDDQSLNSQFRQRCLSSRISSVALESLWSLNALRGFDEALALELLNSDHSDVRKWTVRLLGDQAFSNRQELSKELAERLDHLAETESCIQVRQQLACTAARLSAKQALPIINANIIRDIDSVDSRLPHLWWWAVQQHSVVGREEVENRFTRTTAWKSRLGRDFLLPRLVRRYAAEGNAEGLDSIQRLLEAAPDANAVDDLWSAVLQGWQEQAATDTSESRRLVAVGHPLSQIVLAAWQTNPLDLDRTRLAIEFGHSQPLEYARVTAFDPKTDQSYRIGVLNLLGQVGDLTQVPMAMHMLQTSHDDAIRTATLSIVGRGQSADIAQQLLEVYRRLDSEPVKLRILEILVSRVESAREFLTAVDSGQVDPKAIPLDQVRRLALLDDRGVDAAVTRHWGKLQAESAGEILAEIRRLSNDLRAGPGEPFAGQMVFAKHCGSCHLLFDQGTGIGPDLTTANRQNREFLLTSLVDPSNTIRAEYVSLIVHTSDGRILTGLPVARDANSLTLVDANNQKIEVPVIDIERLRESPISMMPQDIYKQLSPQELRDLFAYLQCDLP